MTDKEKLEKVRAEIEERYKYNKEHENNWAGTSHYWQRREDEEILSFIDSLQEEPVKDELEKVVEEIVDPTVLNAYGAKEIADRLRRTVIESINRDLQGWHVL